MDMKSTSTETAILGQPPGASPHVPDDTFDHHRRWSRRVAVDIVGMCDSACIVAGAWISASYLISISAFEISDTLILRAAIVAAIVVYLCLSNWQMYPTDAMDDFPVRSWSLLVAVTMAVFVVLGIGVTSGPEDYVRVWSWSLMWIILSFVLISTSRSCARAILARLTAARRFDARIAVYGAGPVARHVRDYLATEPQGVTFAGVYDDRMKRENLDTAGLQIEGTLDDLVAASRAGDIDRIIVAMPASAELRIASIAHSLANVPSSLHIVTHVASDLVSDGPALKVSALGPIGLLDVRMKPLDNWAPFLKRLEDYVLGALFLIPALPVMAVIAVAIKLDSPGPVLFRQHRRGANNSVISVLKFRTMSVQEDGPNVRQATENDPRVTRVGKFLRRTSLDELPQLFNVLRGEMSLVGPRPHALAHDDAWDHALREYAKRGQVKPGITGLAQIRGFRGIAKDDAIKDRVRNDLEYIEHWSLGLDLTIIYRTIGAVLVGRNAH